MQNQLIDNSLAAILAAIEIYNKPNFQYRNEVFAILVVNAFELLFKAKILNENGNKIESIYAYDRKGNLKTNRNDTPLTLEVVGTMNHLNLDEVLTDNILSLIEIRDTAIHFVNKEPIDYLIYSLGSASLRNYVKLIAEWFKRDFSEYNFYILPIGFAHHFKTFKLADLDNEPDIVQNLIANIADGQSKTSDNNFLFCCEIELQLVSAKKVTDTTDLSVEVQGENPDAAAIVKLQRLTDRYPLSANEIWNHVHEELPHIKQNDFYRFLREYKIRENEDYAAYNFRYKRHEREYMNTGMVATGTPSIYNYESLAFIITELPKFVNE